MKFVWAVILLGLFSGFNLAQDNVIEKNFEKNKVKFKLEKFSEGEDASSGFDYLVYKDKSHVVKIRQIWSSSANPVFRIEDYFFKNGKLATFARYTFAKKYYKTAVKGSNVPLKQVEKMYLTDSKLAAWIENGKTVPDSDKRWQEKESEVLEAAKSQLENYEFLREEIKENSNEPL